MALAQILTGIELTPEQRPRAVAILKRNLERYEDWIVLNVTLYALRSSPAKTQSYGANWYRLCDAKQISEYAGILWTQLDTTGQRNLDRTQEVAGSSPASKCTPKSG